MNPNTKNNQYNKNGATMTSDGWILKNRPVENHVRIDWTPVVVVLILAVVVILMVVVK